MALSSQPGTQSEAQAILEDTDRNAFNLECTDALHLSHLHLEDIFRQLDGTPLKLYVLKSSVDDIQQWWGTAFQKAVSFQPAPFGTQQINSFTWHRFISYKMDALHTSYGEFCDSMEEEHGSCTLRNHPGNFLCHCANEFPSTYKQNCLVETNGVRRAAFFY
jgi:hypothetical protein